MSAPVLHRRDASSKVLHWPKLFEGRVSQEGEPAYDGYGSGDGDGFGNGDGNGYGYGYGFGNKNGYGNGNGNGGDE
jgi:hypothetical protein